MSALQIRFADLGVPDLLLSTEVLAMNILRGLGRVAGAAFLALLPKASGKVLARAGGGVIPFLRRLERYGLTRQDADFRATTEFGPMEASRLRTAVREH